jgi:3'-phosphoadenosine 5'-phosphosulfate sulfotransferase (PAPS reductase)/FAD synthetase
MTPIQKIDSELKDRIKGRNGVLLVTGDKGSTLLLNLLQDSDIKSVFIDTGFHFDEVNEYIKSLDQELKVIINDDATAIGTDNMIECCHQRKVEPLRKYLDEVKADYIIVPFTEKDKRNGVEDSYLSGIEGVEIIRPLYGIADRDIWLYIKENKLLFTALYKKGYKIIDCKSCTTRVGRKRPDKKETQSSFDNETIEKLKSLGYM